MLGKVVETELDDLEFRNPFTPDAKKTTRAVVESVTVRIGLKLDSFGKIYFRIARLISDQLSER
jgi:hypothetical protein